MKNLFLPLLLLALFSVETFAQCDAEPTLETTGTVLKELKISDRSASAAEYLLTLKAGVPGASWQTRAAEAAVLTVFVDGRYNQDIILFAGEKTFEYRALLGDLDPGEHRVSLVRNQARSAPNAKQVKIEAVSAAPLENSSAAANPAPHSIAAYLAAINAPLIYLRPDTID
jgi:hypothetical protein